jgi:pimeloyl-ACP methyl ester carboxylesterase
VLGHSWGTMLGARLVARWPEDYAGYVGVGQQVSTARGLEVTLDRLAPLIRAGGRAEHLRWLDEATVEGLLDHRAYAETMMMLDAYGGGMNAPLPRLAWMLLRAPEYSLGDLRRWLDGANRGSGPMWPDYRNRDLMAEVPVMPVPMLLISGAQDLNTPVDRDSRCPPRQAPCRPRRFRPRPLPHRTGTLCRCRAEFRAVASRYHHLT